MREEGDTCNACGHWTEQGRVKLAKQRREHPTYDTDMTPPISAAIRRIRDQMTVLRGHVCDLAAGYPVIEQDMADIEGLLTCGISTLYETVERWRAIEAKLGQQVGAQGFEP